MKKTSVIVLLVKGSRVVQTCFFKQHHDVRVDQNMENI